MKASALPKRPAGQPATTRQENPAGCSWLRPLANLWRAISSPAPYTCMPVVEEFEARLLYSADFAPDGLALAASSPILEQRLLDDAGEYLQTTSAQPVIVAKRTELLIVDAGVVDAKALLAGLNTDDRNIEVLLLDPARDGIEQISAALAGRHDLAAIHILSHGADGQLQLGITTLDASQLTARNAEIAGWGTALTDGGDILLYGCDLASTEAGRAFVSQLGQLTGADVAASDDLTGAAKLGGDWDLEYSAGQIESGLAFNAPTREHWQGILETLVNTTLPPTQTNAGVAMNPASGAFVVTWTSNDANKDGIFARIFNADGTPVSAEIPVNTTTTDQQDFSTVGMAADGSFVIAWDSKNQDGVSHGIYAQRFNAAGAKLGGEFLVNQFTTGNQIEPAIAVAADGQFVVAWNDDRNGGDIYVRHFSNTGAALSNEILVNTNTANGQFLPAVAIDSTGSYAVTWQSDSGGSGKAIFAQRFNASDVQLGSEFRVNTYDSNDQIDPTIAMAPDGRFVIAWSSVNQDGSGIGVYAQRYTAAGAADGNEFQVNTYTSNDQDSPVAAMGSSANFVIAWESLGQDHGGSLGVYAQRFDAAGNKVGTEFVVSTTIESAQNLPAVAMDSSGNSVIAWEGAGVGDNGGIFFQNYLPANNPPAANPDTANTDEDTAVSGTAPGIMANDTDLDVGAVLTVSGIMPGTSGTATPVTSGGTTVTGLYGSLLINPDGSYTYTPNATTAQALIAGQSMNDVFTYTLKDDKNAQSTATLTVTVTGLNDAPTATADSYAVVKSGSLSIAAAGVLSNDTDVDTNPTADVLVVSEVNGVAGNVGIALVGLFGTLTLNADGSLIYTPDSGNPAVSALVAGQSVVDGFAYTISDGNGGTSSTTLNIMISGTNTAPISNDDAYTLLEDGSLTVTAPAVLSNDTDDVGNTLTAALVTGPTNGTLTFHSDGSFVYTANLHYSGSDSFTYQASDGSLASNTATVTLTITHVNHAPTGTVDNGSVTQDATLGAGVLSNDTDVDGGDILAVADVTSGTTTVTVVSGTPGVITSSYGTLTLAADGSYTYLADGVLSKALAVGQTSNDVFTYTLSDGQGGAGTATLTLTITGTNDAAVIGSGSGSVTEDATPAASGTLSISDVDAGQASFSAQTGSIGTYGNFTLDAGGNWTYTLDNANAAVQALPASSMLTETFNVASVDGATSSVTLTITGTNDAPMASAVSASGAQNTSAPIAIVLSGRDVDGSVASFALSSLPADGTLYQDGGMTLAAPANTALAASGNTLTLYFQPAANWSGSASFDFVATDNLGLDSGSAIATLTVTPTPIAPAPPLPPAPPAPPESTTQPPVVDKVTEAADTQQSAKEGTATAPLPTEANANDALVTTSILIEEKTTSATTMPASESATSQDRREGIRPNLSPANAAVLVQLDLAILSDFPTGLQGGLPLYEAVTSATESHAFIQELDQLREQMTAEAEVEKHIIGASVAAGTGLSIGYVLWLLRGGVLLSSLMAALPAWRFIDPLPVLGRLKDDSDDEDNDAGEDESLESLVVEQPNNAHATSEENKHA